MTHWKRLGGTLAAATILVGMSLGVPSKAEARGGDADDHMGGHGFAEHGFAGHGFAEHGFAGHGFAGHGFTGHGFAGHGFAGVHLGYWGGPYWGAGWWGSPWWGPYWSYPYYPEGGVSMHAAMLAGYGAIKVDAKPKYAEVWADGKPVAEARDLDGTPSYLWLKGGEHRIQIYEGGFVTFDQKVDVHAGMRTELRVQLDPGASVPLSGKAPETK